ncbi:MAG: NAD-dependent epimerase/dehydratase family protein [Patescibacteria group bacterium]|nr:NAD-dependent epimerase/dehydratase family protein [bacterium]MDZ4240934.1 NAD-dependent epimerase/dehydratase family protein [Patescibacteria group bacterium]
MSKVFVTGGTGFVGSALVRALVAHGDEVTLLVQKNDSQAKSVDGLAIKIVEGDILNLDSFKVAAQGTEVFYHAAFLYTLPAIGIRKEPRMDAVNLQGTKNAVEVAQSVGVKKFVFTSSVYTIGQLGKHITADEKDHIPPGKEIGYYGRTKRIAEDYVLTKARAEGFPAVVVNPSAIFGPGDSRPTPSGEIVIKFLQKKYPGYFDALVAVADVDDVAQGHILAAERGKIGERYILCNEKNYTEKELFEIFEKVSGIPAPKTKFPVWFMNIFVQADEWIRRFFPKHKVLIYWDHFRLAKDFVAFSNKKAVMELGWTTKPFEETARKAVLWYKAHGMWHKAGISDSGDMK